VVIPPRARIDLRGATALTEIDEIADEPVTTSDFPLPRVLDGSPQSTEE
jgi:hypothetical protein